MSEIENIGDDLTSRMPDVQEHVATDTLQSESISSPAGPTDRQGRPFDTALHETTPDGKAVLNKDGTIRTRRGTKRGYKRSRVVDVSQVPDNPGRAIAESVFALGQLIGGEDFVPVDNPEKGINERATMTSAWEGYCDQKGISDFPPGIALTMAMLGYVIPRFYMDKTKSRFARVKTWAMGKWVAWRERRAA